MIGILLGVQAHKASAVRFPMVTTEVIAKDAVRVQLATILGSSTFAGADRLRRFLSYIVEETLAGRGAQIKEFLLGIDVFDRAPLYDPRLDPIVRVEAGRVRKKLRHYYETTGYADPIVIEIARGCYTPTFALRRVASVYPRGVGTRRMREPRVFT